MSLIEIPLVNGIDESWDNKLLPAGALKTAKNVVIKKNGQCQARGHFAEVRDAVDGASDNWLPDPRAISTALGSVCDAGDDYYQYYRNVGGLTQKVGGEFRQYTIQSNQQYSSVKGTVTSAATVDNGAYVFLIEMVSFDVMSIQAVDRETFNPVQAWTVQLDMANSPAAGQYDAFAPFDVTGVWLGVDDSEAIVSVQGTSSANGTYNVTTLGVAYQVDLTLGSPRGGRGEVWLEVDSLDSARTFVSTVSRVPGAAWWANYGDYTAPKNVTLRVLNQLGTSSGMFLSSATIAQNEYLDISGDNSGRIWILASDGSPTYYNCLDGNFYNPILGASASGAQKLNLAFSSTGEVAFILGTDGYFWFANYTLGNISLQLKSMPKLGFDPVGALTWYEDKWYLVASRDQGEVFGLTKEIATANLQAAVFTISLEGGELSSELICGLPGSNIRTSASNINASLAVTSEGLNVLYKQYTPPPLDDAWNPATDSTFFYDGGPGAVILTRIRRWEPVCSTERENEIFFPGGVDYVTDGQAVINNSYIAPPTIDGFGHEPSTTPDGDVITDGSMYVYAIFTQTDDNGYKHRSAPIVGLMPLYYATQEIVEPERLYERWITNYLLVSCPSYIKGAVTVEIYTQDPNDWNYEGYDPDEPLVNRPRSPAQGTTQAVLVAEARVFPGSQVRINLPLFGSYNESEVLSTGVWAGQFLYTIAEVPNDHGPSGSIMAQTRTRVFRNEYDGSDIVQASKVLNDNYSTEWSLVDSFKINMPAPVTGMGAMDTQVVIFTRHGTYSVRGDGPGNDGSGSFATPQNIPGSVGCLSKESVINVPDGVMFQSDRGIHFMRRDWQSPQWVGEAIRSTLTAGHVCLGSAYTAADDTARWSFYNPEDGSGFIAALDLRIKQWFIHDTTTTKSVEPLKIVEVTNEDSVGTINALSGWDDTRGRLFTFTEEESFGYQAELVTGELRMAGIDGHWQGRHLYLLGEKISDTPITVSLSYNGKDFGKYFKTYDISSYDSGTIELKLTIPIQKFDTLSVRVSWFSRDGGSFILNGLSLYYTDYQGGSRLPAKGQG